MTTQKDFLALILKARSTRRFIESNPIPADMSETWWTWLVKRLPRPTSNLYVTV